MTLCFCGGVSDKIIWDSVKNSFWAWLDSKTALLYCNSDYIRLKITGAGLTPTTRFSARPWLCIWLSQVQISSAIFGWLRWLRLEAQTKSLFWSTRCSCWLYSGFNSVIEFSREFVFKFNIITIGGCAHWCQLLVTHKQPCFDLSLALINSLAAAQSICTSLTFKLCLATSPESILPCFLAYFGLESTKFDKLEALIQWLLKFFLITKASAARWISQRVLAHRVNAIGMCCESKLLLHRDLHKILQD